MILTSLLRMILTRSFKPFIFTNTYSETLDFENLNNLGLYVHIPFCRSICSFCPYCKQIYNGGIAEDYKCALLKEIDIVCKGMSEKKQITSLYFGGGTPALMIDDLKDIIDYINKYFIISDGIGVELHPDDISEYNLNKLKDCGVNMVSAGVQSFDLVCLNALGRKENSNELIKKLDLIKSMNFDVTDVDLIFAIPGQTEESLIRDIKTAFEHGATQISTYPFIDFSFANNRYRPMPEHDKKRLLKAITVYIESTDIQRTSIWTFTRPDTKKYSSVTRDSFLGFGISATTLLGNEFKINTFSIESYIDRINQNKLPTSLTINFTKRQRACYYLFWNAYSMCINPRQFEEMIEKPLHKMYGFELWGGKVLGLIISENGEYRLTEKGAYWYHYIEQAYTAAYIDKMWSVSRLTAFPEKIILK